MASLLGFIKENKDLRAIFGVRELKIIEKQLLGINLTQSEKNRLSRDIRKKFRVIKEISKYAEEFELKKASEIQRIVQVVKEDILSSEYFPKIKKIYLFGSSVKNERTFRSDIDIAVEFINNVSLKEATEFRVKFSDKDGIDVQVLNVLPEKIKKSILNNHKILYENAR
ncbi:nucleotidyltransferase domain-containing protein [Candidatus Pacearchaeota archaeon]|nr:nucleotidyltransferase domain-containing protein [Candidatus Pacearchaeota archaeon]